MPEIPEEALRALQPMLDQLGDQRAKDLVDANEGETDPRRAIRRLHRALRYGRTSIQAAKAFQALGMYYEELENARLAIKYYSDAIELQDHLDIPPVAALYWRGQLLYQRGDQAAARQDFTRALALDEPTFFPEERAFAEQVLAGHSAVH